MSEMLKQILHRRTIRRFREEQIKEEELQQILEAGMYAPCAGGRQGVLFVVSQGREVNQRLGKIKRANFQPKMATATAYVSKEQPGIADDASIKNAFYDAPTVVTLFAPQGFPFRERGRRHGRGKHDAGGRLVGSRLLLYRRGLTGICRPLRAGDIEKVGGPW